MNSTQASSSNPSKKIKLTIIPPIQLFVNISSDEEITTAPSPTTTSSSPTPPNAPSKIPSTNQTSSSQKNTSSFFQSKLQISPPSSNEPTSPQRLNPLLDNISDFPHSIFPPTNNQLRALSNPRSQETNQDGRVTVQNFKDNSLRVTGLTLESGKLQEQRFVARVIFMARLSHIGSVNGDVVGPTYDSGILLKNDAAQSVPPSEQDNAMIFSVIEQMQSQVE
ncbi:hypothetical protein Tco_0298935 [Tanacetum coccineum]